MHIPLVCRLRSGEGREEEPASFPDEIESFSGGGRVGGGRAGGLVDGRGRAEGRAGAEHLVVARMYVRARSQRSPSPSLSLLSGDGGAGGSICWGVAAARSTAARASRLQRRECEGGDGM